MSNYGGNSDIKAEQGSVLFEASPVFAGSSARARGALTRDLRESRLSREEVCSELTRLTGSAWTVVQLDAFTAESKPHRFPAELVSAWTYLMGPRLLTALCEGTRVSAATEEDLAFAELGRVRLRGEKLSQRLWEKI